MNAHDFIRNAIERKQPNKKLEKAVTDADLQHKLYSGKNLDDIITDYRVKESDNQKDQRKRITIGRSKHIIRQIGNIFDYLAMMDNPISNVITENKNHKQAIEAWVYNNNIKDFAFRLVKMNGALVDGNAWVICKTNEENEIDFEVMRAGNLYDIQSKNGLTKAVMFKSKRFVDTVEVTDYYYYHEAGIITYKDTKGSTIEPTSEIWNGYLVTEIDSEMMLAFNLGYIDDELNDLPTKVTTLEAASELFRALIQLGADADTVKATHGIVQKFAYSRRCNFTNRTEQHSYQCNKGYLIIDGVQTGEKCTKCNGTGLDIHTSSQDIITFPLPEDITNLPPLSNLVHTLPVAESILNHNRDDLKELHTQILNTVFNSSSITRQEVAQNVTATGEMIDLQGIYATLNTFGKHVSNCFIWMCECYAWFNQMPKVEIIHGYTLSLKLESVETLSEKRKKLIDANAPMEVIRALDLAIIQKQHADSPEFVNRFIVWEQYRPFADKGFNEVGVILANLPNTNYYKILYNFWGHIKKEIENKHGDQFFKMGDDKRKALITQQVEIIQDQIRNDEPQRVSFNDIPQ